MEDHTVVSLFVGRSKRDDDDVSLTSTVPEDVENSEYVVDDVLHERADEVTGVPYYLIKWEGYQLHESTWEPPEHLDEELIESWNQKKAKVDRGEEQPFDLTIFEEALQVANKAKAERHRKRNAKRQQLGLPLTDPPTELVHATDNPSSVSSDEAEGPSGEIEDARPPPINPNTPTCTSAPPKRIKPSCEPSHQLTLSYSDTDHRQSTRKESMNTQSQEAPSSESAPKLLNVKDFGLSSPPGQPSLADKLARSSVIAISTRTPVAAASKHTKVSNIFVSGSQRKPRAGRFNNPSDRTKAATPFSSFRSVNRAKKRALEKDDSAPPNLSAIPSNFILTAGTTASEGAAASEPVMANPAHRFSKKPLKSVRFSETDVVHSSILSPMDLNTGKKVVVTKSPQSTSAGSPRSVADPGVCFNPVDITYSSTSMPTSKSNPLSFSESMVPNVQEVQKTVFFGPPDSAGVAVGFTDIPVSASWTPLFVKDGDLCFRALCTAEDWFSYRIREKILCTGALKQLGGVAMLESVSENLRHNSWAAYLIRPGYSILIYPSRCRIWTTLGSANDGSSRSDIALRYIIFQPMLHVNTHLPPQLGDPTIESRLTACHQLLAHMSRFDYTKMIDHSAPKDEKHVFLLIFPTSEQFAFNILEIWLRACRPDCRIITAKMKGAWSRYITATKHGAVIIEESIVARTIRRLDSLHSNLDSARNFWWLSTSSYYPAEFPSMDPFAGELPGLFTMQRLLPYGRAFLLTPSFIVAEPHALYKFLKWYCNKVSTGANYMLIAPADFPEYLKALAIEKAAERDEFRHQYPKTKILDEILAAEGLSEADNTARHNAVKIVTDFIKIRCGDSPPQAYADDVRRFIWVTEFIEPNDEQSLVNYFAWWSTTRLDQYRRYCVIGSSAASKKKAHRKIEIPNYSAETTNDPNLAQARINKGYACPPATATHRPNRARNHQFNSERVALFGRQLSNLSRELGTSWAVLHRDPVAWVDESMARQFGDSKCEFATFKSWLRSAPEFDKCRNTLLGMFFTTNGQWNPDQSSLSTTELSGHPWVAIYRPVNVHRPKSAYRDTELLIWDADHNRKFHTDTNPDIDELLAMQRHLIELAKIEASHRDEAARLTRVWIGGFELHQVHATNDILDVTWKWLENIVLHPWDNLPPFAKLLRKSGWRLLRGFSDTEYTETERPFESSGVSELYPRQETDQKRPNHIIFHPVGRRSDTSAGTTRCINHLYDEANKARKANPDCEHMVYRWEATEDWYKDLKLEGRDHPLIKVETWETAFRSLKIPII